jgi:hypothetical protein
MCYDFDEYVSKARIAEWMRSKKPVADDLEKQRGATVPAAPREAETHDKDRESVPA